MKKKRYFKQTKEERVRRNKKQVENEKKKKIKSNWGKNRILKREKSTGIWKPQSNQHEKVRVHRKVDLICKTVREQKMEN